MDYVQLLMISWVIQARNIDRNAKKWKRTPKSSKNKILIFGLCSTSDDWPRKKTMTKMQKNEKGPLSHWKIKCLFFNYINFWWLAEQSEQKKDDQDAKKWKRPPKSLKNKMFVFQLHQLLMIGQAIWVKMLTKTQKNEKRPPKSLKNQMFIFGLHSTSDDLPSDPSIKHWAKCRKPKKAP